MSLIEFGYLMEIRSIVWFRSDLRLHDNQALVEAMQSSDEIYPVYIFDPRIYRNKTSFGFRKTGVLRAKFIIEAVIDLRNSLAERGLNLLVRIGYPEDIIFELAKHLRTNWVFCNRERTHEEVLIQDRLEKKLWTIGQEMRFVRGKMLLYTQDLPFPVTHAPDHFATLRKETEHFVRIRKPLDIPEMRQGQLDMEEGEVPTLEELGYRKPFHKVTNPFFRGGENHVINHLQNLLDKKDDPVQMAECGDSRLSPWISHGCLSPKYLYYYAVGNEDNSFFECSKSLAVSLLWRDYYRLIGKKYKNLIFVTSGPLGVARGNSYIDLDRAEPWLNAQTGVPIVDACLTELILTGYLSHRGRILVANHLVNELKSNWLIGAEYFESLLLDYDPCSNYGNWNHVAGVGVDQTKDKIHSFSNQEKLMDPNGTYVEYWLSKNKMQLS